MIEALLLVLKSNVIEIEDKHKYLKRSSAWKHHQ